MKHNLLTYIFRAFLCLGLCTLVTGCWLNEEVCGNLEDDDCDGRVDYDDTECLSALQDFERSCTDGLDNDGDYLIDLDDPDCKPEICGNLLDDDADNLTDYFDPECNGHQVPEVCSDGLDNDGDGLIDGDDGDCIPEDCYNGTDDDGDGDVDLDDEECADLIGPEICDDGIDNDQDGDTDGDDSDCIPEICGNGIDDDNDGDTDFEDTAECVPVPEICDDGLDNDGDGDVDGQDTNNDGSLDDDDSACAPTPEICGNLIDDDLDGDVDFDDIDCGTPVETEDACDTTQLPPGGTCCNDGLDNDGNGLIDADDPYCENCMDFVDNDGDCTDGVCTLGSVGVDFMDGATEPCPGDTNGDGFYCGPGDLNVPAEPSCACPQGCLFCHTDPFCSGTPGGGGPDGGCNDPDGPGCITTSKAKRAPSRAKLDPAKVRAAEELAAQFDPKAVAQKIWAQRQSLGSKNYMQHPSACEPELRRDLQDNLVLQSAVKASFGAIGGGPVAALKAAKYDVTIGQAFAKVRRLTARGHTKRAAKWKKVIKQSKRYYRSLLQEVSAACTSSSSSSSSSSSGDAQTAAVLVDHSEALSYFEDNIAGGGITGFSDTEDPATECDDGIDNDNDGDIDYEDIDCYEVCDLQGDGDVDGDGEQDYQGCDAATFPLEVTENLGILDGNIERTCPDGQGCAPDVENLSDGQYGMVWTETTSRCTMDIKHSNSQKEQELRLETQKAYNDRLEALNEAGVEFGDSDTDFDLVWIDAQLEAKDIVLSPSDPWVPVVCKPKGQI